MIKLKKTPQYSGLAKSAYTLEQAKSRYCSLQGLTILDVIEGIHTSTHWFIGHYTEERVSLYR